jgi:hypothetical protein
MTDTFISDIAYSVRRCPAYLKAVSSVCDVRTRHAAGDPGPTYLLPRIHVSLGVLLLVIWTQFSVFLGLKPNAEMVPMFLSTAPVLIGLSPWQGLVILTRTVMDFRFLKKRQICCPYEKLSSCDPEGYLVHSTYPLTFSVCLLSILAQHVASAHVFHFQRLA